MDYELWIIPNCPNSASALELFRQALVAEGVRGHVLVVEFSSDEQAESSHFHGSPSFIVDDRDLFPSAAPPALACRVYQCGAGLSGMPSLDDLRGALRGASSPL